MRSIARLKEELHGESATLSHGDVVVALEHEVVNAATTDVHCLPIAHGTELDALACFELHARSLPATFSLDVCEFCISVPSTGLSVTDNTQLGEWCHCIGEVDDVHLDGIKTVSSERDVARAAIVDKHTLGLVGIRAPVA